VSPPSSHHCCTISTLARDARTTRAVTCLACDCSFQFRRHKLKAAPWIHTPDADKPAKPRKTATPSPPPSRGPAIPLPQIAHRAEQLDRLLKEISSELTQRFELREPQATLEARGDELRQRALHLRELLEGTPTSLELDYEQRYWRSRSIEWGCAKGRDGLCCQDRRACPGS
jgi:hypothetical protein